MSANKSPTRSTSSLLRRTPAWARALVGVAAVAAVAVVVGGGNGSGPGGRAASGLAAPTPEAAAVVVSAAAAVAPATGAPPAAALNLQVGALAGPAAAVAPAVPLATSATAAAAAAAPRRDLSAYEMPADFVPANADGSTDNPPFAGILLAEISNGQAAVNALGGQLAAVAAWYGKSSAELVQLLLSDRTVHVDRRGRLLHIDDGVAVAQVQAQAPGEHPAYAGTPLPAGTEGADVVSGSVPSTAGAPFPADQTFALHTRSQSSRVIYLNFRGEGSNPAFDLDRLPGTFSTAEQAMIQRIWLRVAEDYAAFDVDITTEAPKATAGKTGVTILVTSRVISAGGYAYLNAFSAFKLAPAPAFCFQNNLANAEKPIAECLSHEVGHTLGLHHQSTASASYYGGQGSGDTGWAPIMGVSYYKNLTQWAKGEYNGATNKEDAYAVMARQGLSPRVDDHGNTSDQASRIAGTLSNGWLAIAANGVIERPGDVDTFSFVAGAGKLSLGVSPSAWSPNVDIALELRDVAGKLIASSNPATQLSASISTILSGSGVYFLSIKGSGKDDPKTTGYSSYGSIGQYAVAGTAAIAAGFVDDHGSSREAASTVTGLVKNGVLTFSVDGAIGATTDADFFKLALVAGKLSVRAVPATGSDNLVLALELQDAAGKVVATSSAATLPAATVSLDVPTAGTFYLRASGTSKGAPASPNGLIGQYSVAGSQTAAITPPAVDDHGNAMAQATELAATVAGGNLIYARTGVIEATGDVDVFKFNMAKPNLSLSVAVTGTAGMAATLGLVLDLLDASGMLVGSTRVGQASATFTLQVPPSYLNKTFYLVVKGVGPGDTKATATAVGKYAISGKAS